MEIVVHGLLRLSSHIEVRGFLGLCLRRDSDQKKWLRTSCAFNTQKAAARLAQSAVMMAFAVKDCSDPWT